MVRRRRRTALVIVTVLLAGSAALFAQKKDEKKDDKKTDAQKKEIQAIVKLVDDVASGQPAPGDVTLAWTHEDYLKATNNKEYVPFTVTIDPSKITTPTVALYWRVVAKDAAPQAAATAGKKDDKDKKKDDKDK